MRIPRLLPIAFFLLSGAAAFAQGTAPAFRYTTSAGVVTLPGKDPAQGGMTVIPTVLVPVRLHFETAQAAGKPATLDPTDAVPRVFRSPVFSTATFGSAACLRSQRVITFIIPGTNCSYGYDARCSANSTFNNRIA